MRKAMKLSLRKLILQDLVSSQCTLPTCILYMIFTLPTCILYIQMSSLKGETSLRQFVIDLMDHRHERSMHLIWLTPVFIMFSHKNVILLTFFVKQCVFIISETFDRTGSLFFRQGPQRTFFLSQIDSRGDRTPPTTTCNFNQNQVQYFLLACEQNIINKK